MRSSQNEGIAAEDAVLFLWATPPTINDAMRVINAWGFRYVTLAFVWTKTTRKSGVLFTGLGHWTRVNAEVVLMGRRGKPVKQSSSANSEHLRVVKTYLVTLEAAIHQRDERIDLLQAIREAQANMIRRFDPKRRMTAKKDSE